MSKSTLATNNEEFDRRFDDGEDIHNLIDFSQAVTVRPGKKCRITLDVSQSLVDAIDRIRCQIGVDRGALIKVWLHERVQEELRHGQIR
ncbi:type II toxin-antitoxin system BrnA family antitoxin [Desulfonatronum parangueonense]